MKADEFLKYSGEHYNDLKKKWSGRLSKVGLQFSEDIYNDSILKVYNALSNHEIEDINIEAFWYKSFIQNTKRDSKYSYHKKDDSIDVLSYLDEFPNEDKPILLSDIEDKLKTLTPIELNLFLIYYLTDMTYTDLEDLTGIKNIRYKIRSIIKKIKGK